MEGRGRGREGGLYLGRLITGCIFLFTGTWPFKLISGIIRYSGKFCHQKKFSFSPSFSQYDNACQQPLAGFPLQAARKGPCHA